MQGKYDLDRLAQMNGFNIQVTILLEILNDALLSPLIDGGGDDGLKMKISRVDRITWKIMKALKYPPDFKQWGTAAFANELARIIDGEIMLIEKKRRWAPAKWILALAAGLVLALGCIIFSNGHI